MVGVRFKQEIEVPPLFQYGLQIFQDIWNGSQGFGLGR